MLNTLKFLQQVVNFLRTEIFCILRKACNSDCLSFLIE